MTRTILAALLLALFLTRTAAAEPASVEQGVIQIGVLIKAVYTHRDENEQSGVDGISEGGLRWVGIDLAGELGDNVRYEIELVANQSLYLDPITGEGQTVESSPFEMGTVGVRTAVIDLVDLVPYSTIRVGTFRPGWGYYQDAPARSWDFVDLPLIHTDEAFRSMGWQNAGAEYIFHPAEWIQTSFFYLNGYMPDGNANSEPETFGGGLDKGKAWGCRIELGSGPVSFWGSYMHEDFEEDVSGGNQPEELDADAWIGGARVSVDRIWATFEWTDLILSDYQTTMSGDRMDLRSIGGHADLGWRFFDAWTVLLRWEWIDPNDADREDTFSRSRFDQITRWTAGLTYGINDHADMSVNFVMPVEEGDKADVYKGRVGGRFQDVNNDYFRVQLQVWQ